MEGPEPHARVTLQMLYSKQLENERLLIQLTAKLGYLDKMPERVSALEIYQAKSAWIEKIAWAALAAGVVSIINSIMRII
jgi:hypothetical protein